MLFAAIAGYHVHAPPPARALGLRPFDMLRFAALKLTAGESMQDFSATLSHLRQLAPKLLIGDTLPDDDNILLEMCKIQSEHISPEERRLSSSTLLDCRQVDDFAVTQRVGECVGNQGTRLHVRYSLLLGVIGPHMPHQTEDDVRLLVLNEGRPPVPYFDNDQLVEIVDAAHAAGLKTRRSVTGIAIFYCSAVVAWKSTLQAALSTSSTEREFIAVVQCARIMIDLHPVLSDLRPLKKGPMPLVIDNEAAFMVINDRRPTNGVRHVGIQHVAIQGWREAGPVIIRFIPGIIHFNGRHTPGLINSSCDLTKLLSWVLQWRHARRNVGYDDGTRKSLASSCKSEITEHQAGECVENRRVAFGSSVMNGPVMSSTTGATRQTEYRSDPDSAKIFGERLQSS